MQTVFIHLENYLKRNIVRQSHYQKMH